jgi:hypothetical protein
MSQPDQFSADDAAEAASGRGGKVHQARPFVRIRARLTAEGAGGLYSWVQVEPDGAGGEAEVEGGLAGVHSEADTRAREANGGTAIPADPATGMVVELAPETDREGWVFSAGTAGPTGPEGPPPTCTPLTAAVFDSLGDLDCLAPGTTGDVLTQTVTGPQWDPPAAPAITGSTWHYRPECIDGLLHVYRYAVSVVAGVLTQGAETLAYYAGCCECPGDNICWCALIPEGDPGTLTLPACVHVRTTGTWTWNGASRQSIAWSGVARLTGGPTGGSLVLSSAADPETPMQTVDPSDAERIWAAAADMTCASNAYSPTTITVDLSDITSPGQERSYNGTAVLVRTQCSPSCFQFFYALTDEAAGLDQAIIELRIGDCAEPCELPEPCCPEGTDPATITWTGTLPDGGCGNATGAFSAESVGPCVWAWFDGTGDWMVEVGIAGDVLYMRLWDVSGADPVLHGFWSKGPPSCSGSQILVNRGDVAGCDFPDTLTISPT